MYQALSHLCERDECAVIMMQEKYIFDFHVAYIIIATIVIGRRRIGGAYVKKLCVLCGS